MSDFEKAQEIFIQVTNEIAPKYEGKPATTGLIADQTAEIGIACALKAFECTEKLLAEADQPDCEWVDETENEDYWITSCGYEFTILDGGNPEENNFLYCNFCGGKITTE